MALRSRYGRAATLLGSCLAWLVLSCAPALAHAGILEASPEEDRTLASPPEQVSLTFNEPVEAEFTPVEVTNERGDRVDMDNARTVSDAPEVVVVDLEENLPGGSYEVDWRVTSADGHPIDGNYTFTVIGGDESREVSTGPEREADDTRRLSATREETGESAARYALYGAVGLAAAGALGVAVLRRR